MRVVSSTAILALDLIVFVSGGPSWSEDEDYAKLAPFTAVEFDERGMRAHVQGHWYRLHAIDGVRVRRREKLSGIR